MKIDPHQPIRQIAIEIDGAAQIFEKYEIDYYKGGEQSLKEACLGIGAPLEKVESELGGKEPLPLSWRQREPDWSREAMAGMIHYLIHVHHVKTRELLDSIKRELAELLKNGRYSPTFTLVQELFQKVDADLRNHMLEEEKTIFPYLIYSERALKKGSAAEHLLQKDKKFTDSVRDILFEHRFMDRGFHEIEKLVFLFGQTGGPMPVEPLTQALRELKRDNEKHVRLENHFLLKRAAQLNLMD